MKKQFSTIYKSILSFFFLSLLVFGCASSSGDDGPSKEDAGKAFDAISTAFDAAADAGTSSSTIQCDVTYNASGWIVSITFINYKDSSSGYTINGTLKETVTGTSPNYTYTFAGTLTLTGGSISKIVYNYQALVNIETDKTSCSGTVTVDGTTFNAADLA